MPYGLRPSLYHVWLREDVIFLDLFHDRYFALPQEVRPLFKRVIEEGVDDEDGLAILTRALGADALRQIDHGIPDHKAGHLQPVRRLVGETHALDPGAALRAIRYRCQTGLWLRFASLEAIMARLQKHKAGLIAEVEKNDAAGSIALAFQKIGPLFPMEDRCLSTSISLTMALFDAQVPATFVIGVRAGPFAAHCWVQHRDVLINDDLEKVRTFSPILVI